MRRRVRMLEEELKRKQQQPEKPYEITKETPPIRELTKEKVTLKKINDKALKNKISEYCNVV